MIIHNRGLFGIDGLSTLTKIAQQLSTARRQFLEPARRFWFFLREGKAMKKRTAVLVGGG
jgi:hypothetical protein